MSVLSSRKQALAVAAQFGGGTTTTNQGSIDPALVPLFQASGRRLMDVQQQMPLQQFGGAYPMQVAGMSNPELAATSQAYGTGDPNSLDAMALSQIFNMQSTAMAGPTTGDAMNSGVTPGMAMDMLQQQYGQLPQGYGQPTVAPFGPTPGPLERDPANPNGPGFDPNDPRTYPTGGPPMQHDPNPPAPGTGGGGGTGPNNGGPGSGQMSVSPQGSTQNWWDNGGMSASAASTMGAPRQTPITVPPHGSPQVPPARPPAPGPGQPPRSGPPGGPPPFGGQPPPPGPRDVGTGVTMGGGPSSSTWRAINEGSQQPAHTTGATPFGQSPGIQAGYQQVQGQQIQNDPAIAAAMADFRRQVAPGIQNDAALAGLGNSSAMVNSLGQAQSSMLTPLYQDAFAREQHTQDRGYGATEEELARRERSSVRGAEAQQSAIDRLMAMSQQQRGNQAQEIGQLSQLGQTARGVQQQGNESSYNDMLRRQALSEAALYQPFGGMLPSAFGSRQVSTGK